jgi:hypothetical protein
MKWDTATGILPTDGSVHVDGYYLPQFTWKRQIRSSFHMFTKHSTDKYDLIFCRDLLKDLGLDIHYSVSQFVWDNIVIDMVPADTRLRKEFSM